MSAQMYSDLLLALGQTVWMVIVALFFAVLIGMPLGALLFIWRHPELNKQPALYKVLSGIINAMRSIPFIILVIAIIPFTRLLAGTSIGTNAAIVPLSVAAFPFFARVVENALVELPKGLIEAAIAMGASTWQVIVRVLLPEAQTNIVRGMTLTAVTLVGYSAMAGVVGGGGLGDLAMRYGYERFNIPVMVVTVVVLIALVQLMQWLGDWLATKRLV